MHGSNNKQRLMKEHEDRYVALMEKHAHNVANTITSMKHKHRYVVILKSTQIDGANTAAVIVSIAA